MKTLQQCLQDYPRVLLEAIAELRKVPLVSDVRKEMVDQLVAALTDPPSIVDAVASGLQEATASTMLGGSVRAATS